MNKDKCIDRANAIAETLNIVEHNARKSGGSVVRLNRGTVESIAKRPNKRNGLDLCGNYTKRPKRKPNTNLGKKRTVLTRKDSEALDNIFEKKKKTFLNDFLPEKGDSFGRLVSKFFVGCAYASFVFSAVWLVDHYVQEYQAEVTQHEIRELYTITNNKPTMRVPDKAELPQGTMGTEDKPPVETVPEEKPPEPLVLLPTAEGFLAVNKDTAGYIRIPNTKCDSVVVQGTDNDYYLSHNFYNEAKQCGTLFVDYRAVINTYNDTQNLIIYGHNQKDNTMFGDLDKYKDSSYWKTNPVIYFSTNYANCEYLILGAFVTNERAEHDNDFVFDYWNYLNFNAEYPFEEWKKEILERTYFTTGYDFDDTDSYITLSTCSTEWEPSRLVIIARKLRENETVEDISTEGWVRNTNPKRPQIWYDLYDGGRKWQPTEVDGNDV